MEYTCNSTNICAVLVGVGCVFFELDKANSKKIDSHHNRQIGWRKKKKIAFSVSTKVFFSTKNRINQRQSLLVVFESRESIYHNPIIYMYSSRIEIQNSTAGVVVTVGVSDSIFFSQVRKRFLVFFSKLVILASLSTRLVSHTTTSITTLIDWSHQSVCVCVCICICMYMDRHSLIPVIWSSSSSTIIAIENPQTRPGLQQTQHNLL